MEKNINTREKTEIIDYLTEADLGFLSEYCDFNLSAMAQKIKLQTYRPKPKMLYL